MKQYLISKNNLYFICIISFFLITNELNAQINEWSEQPAISAYYSSLKLDRNNYSSPLQAPNEKYFENTLNLSFSLPITQRIRVGAQVMTMAHKAVREPIDRSFATGIFVQYNVWTREKLGIYLEGGYTFGNICPCGEDKIFTSDSLNHFVQFGLAAHYKITDQFHLKAGLIYYEPILGHPEIYNWTQPFIGLKFYFNKKRTITKENLGIYWEDDHVRKWNIGLTSSNVSGLPVSRDGGSNNSSYKYREFTITPSVNYWINQAVTVGVQGTYYHYQNDYSRIPSTYGLGLGLQTRFYPLSLKNTDQFRAFRIGRKGHWNISPIVGAALHISNFSWQEPEKIGEKWQYFDFQPYAGLVLSYKHALNLVWSVGPIIGNSDSKIFAPTNGVRVLGLEYNF